MGQGSLSLLKDMRRWIMVRPWNYRADRWAAFKAVMLATPVSITDEENRSVADEVRHHEAIITGRRDRLGADHG